VAEGDEVVVTGETYDVTDPAGPGHAGRAGPAPLPVTCDGEETYGLVEPYDTLCYEVCSAGVMGFSLLDG